jgi:hypothetical protein
MRFAKFSAREDGKDLYVNPTQVVFVAPAHGSRNGSIIRLTTDSTLDVKENCDEVFRLLEQMSAGAQSSAGSQE